MPAGGNAIALLLRHLCDIARYRNRLFDLTLAVQRPHALQVLEHWDVGVALEKLRQALLDNYCAVVLVSLVHNVVDEVPPTESAVARFAPEQLWAAASTLAA